MNKNEFNDWVQDIYQKFIEDEKAIVAYEDDEKIIVLDTEIDEIFAHNFIESEEDLVIDPMINIAVAYAKLRKIEIPTIDKEPKFEREPKFEKVKEGEFYWHIVTTYGKTGVQGDIEDGFGDSERFFNNNNYFLTEERAEEVADKMNFLLKLERLHDTYCSEYKPDWENEERECYWYVKFDSRTKRYEASWNYYKVVTTAYFDNREIAEKVCDELNKELKMPF